MHSGMVQFLAGNIEASQYEGKKRVEGIALTGLVKLVAKSAKSEASQDLKGVKTVIDNWTAIDAAAL